MSTDSIGSAGGRDWATLADWFAGIPGTLLENEIGEVYNDSEFTLTSEFHPSGKTIGSFTINLRAAAGQGFKDSASGGGFKLDYVASQGAAFTGSLIYASIIYIAQSGMTVTGLQFRNTSTGSSNCVKIDVSASVIRDCIAKCAGADSNRYAAEINNSAKLINCLVIHTRAASTRGVSIAYGSQAINVTCVRPSGLAAAGTGFFEGGGTTNVAKNCASFNFTTAFTTSGWDAASDYNCADDANAPGANSQQSKTYSNQFVSTTDDWRLKSGADCIDHGNTDSTNAPNDIVGTVRGATTSGDIGAWEFVAAAGGGGAVVPRILKVAVTQIRALISLGRLNCFFREKLCLD